MCKIVCIRNMTYFEREKTILLTEDANSIEWLLKEKAKLWPVICRNV